MSSDVSRANELLLSHASATRRDEADGGGCKLLMRRQVAVCLQSSYFERLWRRQPARHDDDAAEPVQRHGHGGKAAVSLNHSARLRYSLHAGTERSSASETKAVDRPPARHHRAHMYRAYLKERSEAEAAGTDASVDVDAAGGKAAGGKERAAAPVKTHNHKLAAHGSNHKPSRAVSFDRAVANRPRCDSLSTIKAGAVPADSVDNSSAGENKAESTAQGSGGGQKKAKRRKLRKRLQSDGSRRKSEQNTASSRASRSQTGDTLDESTPRQAAAGEPADHRPPSAQRQHEHVGNQAELEPDGGVAKQHNADSAFESEFAEHTDIDTDARADAAHDVGRGDQRAPSERDRSHEGTAMPPAENGAEVIDGKEADDGAATEPPAGVKESERAKADAPNEQAPAVAAVEVPLVIEPEQQAGGDAAAAPVGKIGRQRQKQAATGKKPPASAKQHQQQRAGPSKQQAARKRSASPGARPNRFVFKDANLGRVGALDQEDEPIENNIEPAVAKQVDSMQVVNKSAAAEAKVGNKFLSF